MGSGSRPDLSINVNPGPGSYDANYQKESQKYNSPSWHMGT
jgi:hypothetical protein